MGSPLIFDPTKLGYEYASVWSIDVSNIPAYAKSVQEFISETKDSFDGVFELHESISGGEDYVSHYFVARSNNLTDWLKGREAVFNSGAALKFINSSQKSATTINNFAARLLRIYN
jgi:predicted S18 family serine protease